MDILSWLRHGARAGAAQDDQRTSQMMVRILQLHPRLRLARHYQDRLAGAIACSLDHADGIVAALPAPREASAAAWSADPYIHAFFAGPGDIAQLLSRSAALRAFFQQNADAAEAYAVLGMTMLERHVLGAAWDGDAVRRDVLQTTLSFTDHQVRICARTEQDLRQEIVRRVVEQLGLEGLARIAADNERRKQLEQERALLKTRLQLLERQGTGMRSMVGGGVAAGSEELARLKEQIEENDRNMGSLGARSEAIEHELDCLCVVLAEPGVHIYMTSRRIRLDWMNIVLPERSAQDGTQAGDELAIQIARIPAQPPETRAFALVRFARHDLIPVRPMLDEAARLLN